MLPITPFAYLLILSALLCLFLTWLAWRRRSAAGGETMALLMLALAGWTTLYLLELLHVELATKLFLAKVQYVPIQAIPALWLVFVLQYTGRGAVLTSRVRRLLLVVPVLTILLIWTTEQHGLIYRQAEVEIRGALHLLAPDYGPFFWVQGFYNYAIFLLATGIVAYHYRASTDKQRGSTALLLIGSLAPISANLLYLTGLNPFPGVDLTPVLFIVTGVAAVWALLRYHLLDLLPAAREALVENISDAVVVVDSQQRIFDLNSGGEQLVALTRGDASGAAAASVLPGWSDIAMRFDAGHMVQMQVEKPLGDDVQYFDVRVWSLHQPKSDSRGWLAVYRDITEQASIAIENAQLYQSLQTANKQLSAALAARAETIQNVSHEMRTPLTIVLGYIEFLQTDQLGKLNAEQHEALDIVRQQGRRLQFMINRLLILQTFDQEKLNLELVDFDSWLSSTLEAWRYLTADAHITLRCDIPSDLPLVRVATRHMEMVIANLLDNAVKFSAGGSEVTISAYPEGDAVIVCVQDQGIGLETGQLESIFHQFYQVDGAMTRRFGGMGIGLTLCRTVINAHRGRIWAESDGLKQGSRFYISLPAVEED